MEKKQYKFPCGRVAIAGDVFFYSEFREGNPDTFHYGNSVGVFARSPNSKSEICGYTLWSTPDNGYTLIPIIDIDPVLIRHYSRDEILRDCTFIGRYDEPKFLKADFINDNYARKD